LHYLGAHNQYETAASQVCSILESYDSDKQFPVWGFGGKPNWLGQMNMHCFPLNGNPQLPYVATANGVLQLYRNTLQTINLSGPTYFAPVISNFMNQVSGMAGQPIYHILLILTDGEIHDMF